MLTGCRRFLPVKCWQQSANRSATRGQCLLGSVGGGWHMADGAHRLLPHQCLPLLGCLFYLISSVQNWDNSVSHSDNSVSYIVGQRGSVTEECHGSASPASPAVKSQIYFNLLLLRVTVVKIRGGLLYIKGQQGQEWMYPINQPSSHCKLTAENVAFNLLPTCKMFGYLCCCRLKVRTVCS